MKSISIWAKKNNRFAIGLIVLIEVVNIAFGIRLGRVILPVINERFLDLFALAIVLAMMAIENNYEEKAKTLCQAAEYRLRMVSVRALFIGTFLLAIVFGNIVQQRLNPTTASLVAWASNITEEARQPVSKKQMRHELRTTLKAYKKATKEGKPSNTGLIIGGILFLLVGLFFGAGLVCAIGCAAPAGEIILYALLTVGCLFVGIKLLSKAAKRKRQTQ